MGLTGQDELAFLSACREEILLSCLVVRLGLGNLDYSVTRP